tara:strand:- start:190 stop:1461 length:1272 start_codon:yes stop_codon:yes gene_type:complete
MSKQKPNCLESEKGVIGSVLLDSSRMKNCISLSSKHFYTERHKYLWDALKEMYVQNIDMDTLTVRNYLVDKKILHQCGGEEYLLELQDSTIVPSHSKSYRDRVLETYDLRKEIEVYESGLIKAYDGQSSADRVMSSLVRSSINNQDSSMDKICDEWVKDAEEGNTGHLEWPFTDWNLKLSRLSSEVCIIHAPRSTGKTAWLLQYICHLHKKGMKCSFASIEMIKQELVGRFIAHLGQVNTYTIRTRGFMTDNEKEKVHYASQKLKDLNLNIRDGSMNIMEIRAWALSEKKNGADCIMIDNLLCINDGGRNFTNRTAMYDYFIQQLVDLRNDIKIPIFLLAHPSAEGLVAYSRNIENLCDVILYLHTVPYEGIDVNGKTIHQNHETSDDTVVCKWQKNRNGLSPVAVLDFDKSTQTFKHKSWEE